MTVAEHLQHLYATPLTWVVVTAGALLVLLLLRWVIPGASPGRHNRGRMVTLVLALVLQLAALLFRSLGAAAAFGVLHFIGLLLLAFSITGVADLLFFEGLLLRLRIAVPPILRDMLQAAAFFVLAMLALTQIGVNVLHLVTTSAIITAVIGLALQSTISNLFAGLALQLDDTLHIGQWIRVGNQIGRITQMNWRAVCLHTKDGDIVVVPNAELLKLEVQNFSAPSLAHRMWLRVHFDYRHPPNEVRRIVTEAITGVPGVLTDPPPDCWPVEFGESAMIYAARYWIDDFVRDTPIEGEIRSRIWYSARRAGLHFPFPRRSVLLTEAPPQESHGEDLSERLEALCRTDLFSRLTPPEKELLAASLTRVRFGAGEHIIRQGEPGDSLYLIHAGRVSVVLNAEGGSHEVAQLGPGEFFGEMSLVTGQPRATTCIACTDVACFVLKQAAFGRLLADRPQVAEDVSQVITSRRLALAAEREEMSQEARERRTREASSHLLSMIRGFFGLS